MESVMASAQQRAAFSGLLWLEGANEIKVVIPVKQLNIPMVPAFAKRLL
ncbi:hypothetical protein [Streptomyces sp. 3N207]